MLKIDKKKYGVGEPQALGFSSAISSMCGFSSEISSMGKYKVKFCVFFYIQLIILCAINISLHFT